MKQYATAIFDSGKGTEKRFSFESLNESITNNSLSMNVHYSLDEEIPDLSPFKDYTFSTLNIIDKDGKNVPIFGAYTFIIECSLNYFSTDNIYTVNMMLGQKES